MIRITWFGKETQYSAKIAPMAFALAYVHFVWYILLFMMIGFVPTNGPGTFIGLASFMLLTILLVASKAERRMFLLKDFKFVGILAWCYWLALLVFHAAICIKPDLYLLFFPNLLDLNWQSFLLFVPAVLFGILELTLGNKYFRQEDWESEGDQPKIPSSTIQEPPA